MANELRIYQDFMGGRLSADHDGSTTTLSSPGLVPLAVVDATNHMLITLDPDGLVGAPEIVRVTAHTAGSATATVVRAAEGTTARAHPNGTSWNHGPVASDMRTSRKTVWAGAGSDLNTTSTSFVDIEATNVPALPLPLAVGDVVEMMLMASFGRSASGVVMGLDWLIDRPVSADTNLRGSLWAAHLWEPSSSSLDVNTMTAIGLFQATEAGVHSFKPQWKVSAGTAYVRLTGTYSGPVFHRITNLGGA